MGTSMGVPSVRATTTAEFVTALERAFKTPGPHLIDAVVPGTITGLKLKLLPRVLGSLAGLPAPLGRAIKRKLAP
jgi:acetolactate synthase-1/2/3 large subunit